MLGHVVANMTQKSARNVATSTCRLFFTRCSNGKWLGDKTNGGFYKKLKREGQEDERLALDWKTLDYRPRQKPKFPRSKWPRMSKQPARA